MIRAGQLTVVMLAAAGAAWSDVRELAIDPLTTTSNWQVGGHRINYRHIIWSLVRKPGAFERYRYREDLFPTPVFRETYDRLADALASTRKADIEYLRILHLAASTMQCEVEAELRRLLADKILPLADRVKDLVIREKPEIPDVKPMTPDLEEYDGLLTEFVEVG